VRSVIQSLHSTSGANYGVVDDTVLFTRIVFALMHSNDEAWMVDHLFGRNAAAFRGMKACIWSLTLPPRIATPRQRWVQTGATDAPVSRAAVPDASFIAC
jgi:phage tail tape-measure protein